MASRSPGAAETGPTEGLAEVVSEPWRSHWKRKTAIGRGGDVEETTESEKRGRWAAATKQTEE